MNVVQEIHRINELELASGSKGSWHDQYKDSAYIYVGGLAPVLTEGDVITIFSQYGEVVDISLPRDQATQKTKGFAFLMYADQRSTVLAVDNLGGAKVLERTLRVDHVKDYKQLERDQDTGKMKEREEQRLAAHPDNFRRALPGAARDDDYSGSDSDSSHPSIDIDDPMRDYLIAQKREAKKSGGGKSSSRKEEKEERRKRKEERQKKRELKKLKAGSSSGKDQVTNRERKREREHDEERPSARGDYAKGGRRRDDDRDYDKDRRTSADHSLRRDEAQRGGRYEERDAGRGRYNGETRRDDYDRRDDRRGGRERD